MRRRPVVAIVGLGLIGGSLARALTKAGYRVIGVDRRGVRRRALAARAVAQTAASPVRAASRADVVVLAAPPGANLRILGRLARARCSGVVITDVGSVKAPICREARRLHLDRFVGGHPMAGNERSGFGASSATLFRRRPWILTPAAPGFAGARIVRHIVRAVGGRPVVLTPGRHDRVMAFLSHVPQIASWAIRGAALDDAATRRHLALSGPGFQDMTRLASSPRGLWREILAQNHRETARALRALIRRLRAEPW
jgi:prephenate dehydrogenase